MQAPRIYHCMAPSRLSSSSLTCRRAARPCRLSSGVRRWRGASGGARSRWTARPARWAALPARHARLPCPALPASSASRQLLPGSPSGAAQPAGSASVHRLVAPWPAPPCLQIVDRESRQLALMIASTRRPVELDEAEQQVGDGGGLVVGWWGRRVGGWVLGGWGLHRVVGRGRQTGGSCWALRAVSLPGRQLTGLGPCCPACSAHALGASASLTCHAPPPLPQLLDERERHFLHTALLNYSRCLQTGDAYDLRVVFRVVQLWLRCGPVCGPMRPPSPGRQCCKGGREGRVQVGRTLLAGSPRTGRHTVMPGGVWVASPQAAMLRGVSPPANAFRSPFCCRALRTPPLLLQAGRRRRGESAGGGGLPAGALLQVPAPRLPGRLAHVGRWAGPASRLPVPRTRLSRGTVAMPRCPAPSALPGL